MCCGPFMNTYGARYGKGSQLCGSLMYSETIAANPTNYYNNATQTMIGYFENDSSDGWTKAGTWITYNELTSVKAIAEYASKLNSHLSVRCH